MPVLHQNIINLSLWNLSVTAWLSQVTEEVWYTCYWNEHPLKSLKPRKNNRFIFFFNNTLTLKYTVTFLSLKGCIACALCNITEVNQYK